MVSEHDHREQLKHALRRLLVVMEGTVSRRGNILNLMTDEACSLSTAFSDRHCR